MERGATNIWPMAAAWDAAVEVTAVAYGVAPGVISAESRGRGPRPPRSAWEAKRMAVYLTVVLSACDYAELGRMTGLHRDTVASHCAKARDLAAVDEQVERMIDLLSTATTTRLTNSGVCAIPRRIHRAKPETKSSVNIDALETYLGGLLATARAALSDERPLIRHTPASSDTSRIRDQKPRNAA